MSNIKYLYWWVCAARISDSPLRSGSKLRLVTGTQPIKNRVLGGTNIWANLELICWVDYEINLDRAGWALRLGYFEAIVFGLLLSFLDEN